MSITRYLCACHFFPFPASLPTLYRIILSGLLPPLHVPHPTTRNPRTPQATGETGKAPSPVRLDDGHGEGADPLESAPRVARHDRGTVRRFGKGQEVTARIPHLPLRHPPAREDLADFQYRNDGESCERDEEEIICGQGHGLERTLEERHVHHAGEKQHR